MTGYGSYFRNAKAFKKDAFAVLRSKFSDRKAFERFYEAIPDARKKNEFLRICCYYRYLAKHGKWKVFVRGINRDIDYLDNTYKLVAIFSLIESLSEEKHQDFFEWLNAQKTEDLFPIKDKAELKKQYAEYKAAFGAIRRCIAFFDRLSLEQKRSLCRSISTNGRPTESIKKLAEYLYLLRSKFVHEAELVLELGTGPIHSIDRRGVTHSTLSVDAVFDAFENGVIAYFSQ